MANKATITFSDGTEHILIYRLAAIARFLRRKRAIKEFEDIKSTPIVPWNIEMAFSDALIVPAGKEIARIEIEEKVTS